MRRCRRCGRLETDDLALDWMTLSIGECSLTLRRELACSPCRKIVAGAVDRALRPVGMAAA